jgi:hypothetical protein
MDASEIGIILMAVLNLIVWHWLILRKIITPSPRALFMLTLLNSAVILLHGIAEREPYTVTGWFFNVNFEHNLNVIVSSAYLLSIAIMALVIGARFITRSRTGIVWLIWGAAYLYLSYDETYMFHESIRRWKFYFAGLGALLVLVALYGGWFADRANWRIYALLIVGLGITAAGGVLLDDTVKNSYRLEEFAELIGTSLVLAAVFTYLSRLSEVDWRPVRQLLVVGNVGWIVVMVLTQFWPLPALEARFLAKPASADYLDGALSLIGYQVDDRVHHPGDILKVTTYWRANQALSENYAQSVRLLSPPDGEPQKQSDLLLGPPVQPTTNIWPVNFVFRKEIYLQTEESLASPVSYWLSLNVWRAPWDSGRDDNMLLVEQTDHPLLLPDTLLLSHVTFITPGNSVPPAPQTADYRFDNGICLCGYALSADESLRFWWKTGADVDQELVQFLHLHRLESDTVVVADRPPLDDQLPTEDWPADLQVIGEWLLEDLSEGQYEVFTGLYERASQNRIPVRDAQGEPIPDNRIYLGTLTING